MLLVENILTIKYEYGRGMYGDCKGIVLLQRYCIITALL